MIEDRAIASCPLISIKIRKIKGGRVVDVDDKKGQQAGTS